MGSVEWGVKSREWELVKAPTPYSPFPLPTIHSSLPNTFMTSERWMQVDQLLQEALEREPEERAAFLDQACGDDDELRREVESLLGFHGRAGAFIEKPPAVMAAALLEAKESRV